MRTHSGMRVLSSSIAVASANDFREAESVSCRREPRGWWGGNSRAAGLRRTVCPSVRRKSIEVAVLPQPGFQGSFHQFLLCEHGLAPQLSFQ